MLPVNLQAPERKEIVKTVFRSVVTAAAIFAVRRRWSLVGLSDACALSGIVFLIVALFRLARWLRFYDLIIYGFRKFKQIWKNEKFLSDGPGGYGAFVESRRYEKNYVETFIAAACMFLCSIAILGI